MRVFRILGIVLAGGLGLLVLAQWPASGLWVIGMFVGIELIFYGGAWVALSLSLRNMA